MNTEVQWFDDLATDKEKTFAYLEPALKRQAEKLAQIRARSLSNLIEWLVMNEVREAEKSGELPPATNEDQDEG